MTEWRKISSRGSREIYYTDLRVSSEIFANEWDKRILLDSIGKFRKLFDFELYAFCVLNDSIRLLIGGSRLKASGVRHMLATLLERYDNRTDQIGEYDLLPPGMMARACVVRIEGEQNAIDVLRFIHLTPSSEGYSLSAGDYWWTSFSSYRGRYCWPMVDAEVVMRVLERQDRQAAKSLLEYHRRAEYMRNPAPECIRNREYHLLDWKRDYVSAGISEENLNETFGA